MKIRTLAIKGVAGAIVGGFVAGKLGLKAAKTVLQVAAKSPKVVKSFASDVVKEVKTEKVVERSLVVVK